MSAKLSKRLQLIVDSLPLKSGMRVLEIGCGPGAMAAEVLKKVGDRGFVLAIDRSAKSIALAKAKFRKEIAKGQIQFLCCSAENFELQASDRPFDLAVAIRVGVFDGRYPEAGVQALKQVRAALKTKGRFFIDTGSPLNEVRFKK